MPCNDHFHAQTPCHLLVVPFLIVSRPTVSQISPSASTGDLLQLPFLGKLLIQLLKILHDIRTSLDNGLFRR